MFTFVFICKTLVDLRKHKLFDLKGIYPYWTNVEVGDAVKPIFKWFYWIKAKRSFFSGINSFVAHDQLNWGATSKFTSLSSLMSEQSRHQSLELGHRIAIKNVCAFKYILNAKENFNIKFWIGNDLPPLFPFPKNHPFLWCSCLNLPLGNHRKKNWTQPTEQRRNKGYSLYCRL